MISDMDEMADATVYRFVWVRDELRYNRTNYYLGSQCNEPLLLKQNGLAKFAKQDFSHCM